MGTYYKWLCPERKEYLDVGNLPHPQFGAYGIKGGAMPYSAWAVAALCLTRWHGCAVKLVGDYGDEYDAEGYEEATHAVLEELYYAPPEALHFMARAAKLTKDKSPVKAHEDVYRKALETRLPPWPGVCKNAECDNVGERHAGPCAVYEAPPTEPVALAFRQYFMGLGTARVEPGATATLGGERYVPSVPLRVRRVCAAVRPAADVRLIEPIPTPDPARELWVRVRVNGVNQSPGGQGYPVHLGAYVPIEFTLGLTDQVEVSWTNDGPEAVLFSAGVMAVAHVDPQSTLFSPTSK